MKIITLNNYYTLIIIVSLTFINLCIGCPRKCICISQPKAIPASYCNGLKLETIPKNIARNTEILSLRLNNIKNITDQDLSGLHNLRRLNLVFNDIEYISNNAFHDLRKLKSLNLGNNNIKTLSMDVFRNLISLEELFINNNLLRTLPKDIFTFLPNLKRLSLQSNQLIDDENEVFSNLHHLEVLNLAHNKLDTISARMFQNSIKLRAIYMDDNKIKTINSKAFDTLSVLSEVYLDNNAIVTFNEDLFKGKQKLNRLSIYNNPLRCDCNLFWIQDALIKGFPTFQHIEKTICETPLMLEGKPMSMLRKESLNCFGQWTSWKSWSECDKSCGGGVRHRTRMCNTNARSGDISSCKGNEVKTETCNDFPCSNGIVSRWSEWSPCSTSCNLGIRRRERRCINPYTGKESPNCRTPLTEIQRCLSKNCPVDGQWSSWSVWSECSKSCGLGIKTRNRSCDNPKPRFGGALCPGGHSETQNKICFQALCPPKLHWSSWSEFTECSVSCGKGYQLRTRACLNEYNVSINILNVCPGDKEDTKNCVGTSSSCRQDGGWSNWLSWSQCTPMSCKRYRSRTCTNPLPTKDGSACEGPNRQDETCDSKYCILNAIWSQWQAWSSCSHECNGGIRRRYRACPGDQFKQVTCGKGKHSEEEKCNQQPCVDKSWSNWGKWNRCNENGRQTRRRQCVGNGKGKCQGKQKERRHCTTIDVQGGEVVTKNNKKCTPRGVIPYGSETVKRFGNVLMAHYKCQKHYKLKGDEHMTCIEDKGWSSTSSPYCIPICGKPGFKNNHWSHRARLFGGKHTVPHSWPWQVAIEVKTLNEGWKLRCGGSLINNRWIVTAGHCLFDKKPTRLFNPDEVKIFLGVHDVTQRYKDSKIQIREAKYVKVHEKFDHPTLDNDLGLIELREEVKLTDEVLPICLPSSRQKNLASVGKKGTVVGWGVTRAGNVSAELKELVLPVVSKKDCEKAYEENYNVTSRMFCAGEHRFTGQPIDTCKGDSGGGFQFHDKRKKKWTLQGIVSWGSKQCGEPGKFSVYTKVTAFTRWIRKTMKNRLFVEKRRRSAT